MSEEFKVVEQMNNAVADGTDEQVLSEMRKYGNTPVYYGPTRSMLKPLAKKGLLDKIKESNNADEIEALIAKGIAEYKNVSPKTVKHWKKAGAARIAQLK